MYESQKKATKKYMSKSARVAVFFTPAEKDLYDWVIERGNGKFVKEILKEVRKNEEE